MKRRRKAIKRCDPRYYGSRNDARSAFKSVSCYRWSSHGYHGSRYQVGVTQVLCARRG